MIVRPFGPEDATALAAFACAVNGRAHEAEVQRWIRKKAHGWVRASVHNHLRLLQDDDDTIVGVAGFEPGLAMRSLFVPLVAVRTDRRGNMLGPSLFETCLDEMRTMCPDGTAYWHVHEDNATAARMSREVGADLDSKTRRYFTYIVRL